MAVTAAARVSREVILIPERVLYHFILVAMSGYEAEVKVWPTYSASNWLGKIRSAKGMIFLYAGTTSSLTYSLPWSPMTGSRTDIILVSVLWRNSGGVAYPRKMTQASSLLYLADQCRWCLLIPRLLHLGRSPIA
jgi:hypothetical protein